MDRLIQEMSWTDLQNNEQRGKMHQQGASGCLEIINATSSNKRI